MDKGIEKLQKHLLIIEKANNNAIDKTLNRILKLENIKLSDISYNKMAIFEILIHKDTNNFPQVKQKLLEKFSELHTEYPFLNIYFDPNTKLQPYTKKITYNFLPRLKSQNDNRLILKINWEDFMRFIKNKDTDIKSISLPDNPLKNMFDTIKQNNYKIIKNSINDIFSNAEENIDKNITETIIRLQNKTLFYEVTRAHYKLLAQQIMKNYNGVIELIINNSSVVTIKVHWNIYLSQLATLEHQQRHVSLLSHSSDFTKTSNPEYFGFTQKKYHRVRRIKSTDKIRKRRHRNSSSTQSETMDISEEHTESLNNNQLNNNLLEKRAEQLTNFINHDTTNIPVNNTELYKKNNNLQEKAEQLTNNIPATYPLIQLPTDNQPSPSLTVNSIIYPSLDDQTLLFLAPSPPTNLPNINNNIVLKSLEQLTI